MSSAERDKTADRTTTDSAFLELQYNEDSVPQYLVKATLTNGPIVVEYVNSRSPCCVSLAVESILRRLPAVHRLEVGDSAGYPAVFYSQECSRVYREKGAHLIPVPSPKPDNRPNRNNLLHFPRERFFNYRIEYSERERPAVRDPAAPEACRY